jgi:hypothetical protein
MRREAASADTLIVVLYAPLYSIMHLPGSIDRNMVIGTDTTYQFDMIRMIVGNQYTRNPGKIYMVFPRTSFQGIDPHS